MGNSHSGTSKKSKQKNNTYNPNQQQQQQNNRQQFQQSNQQDIELQGLLYMEDKNFTSQTIVLKKHLQKHYKDLNQKDIEDFTANHPWLIHNLLESQDPEDQISLQNNTNFTQQSIQNNQNIEFNQTQKNIIQEEIIQFVKAKIERIKILKQMLLDPDYHQKESNNKLQTFIEEFQQQQENTQKKNLPSEYYIIQEIDSLIDLVQQKQQQSVQQQQQNNNNNQQATQTLQTHLNFLLNSLLQILNNPTNEETRLITLNKFMHKYWRQLRQILIKLGFVEIESENEDDYCQMIFQIQNFESLQKTYNYIQYTYKEHVEKFQYKQIQVNKINMKEYQQKNKDIIKVPGKGVKRTVRHLKIIQQSQNQQPKIKTFINDDDNDLPNLQQQQQQQQQSQLQNQQPPENMSPNEERVYYMKRAQQKRNQLQLTDEMNQFYQNQNQEFDEFGKKQTNQAPNKYYQNQPNNKKQQNPRPNSQMQKYITMEQLETQRIKDDKRVFEILAWELSNKFREQNGLHPVAWSEKVSEICYVHSENMGKGIVPFSHDGFNDRAKEIGHWVPIARCCENVAYSNQYINLAERIVQGWINSPGHRKNLLSPASHSGIGVYRSWSGNWYFTQIFIMVR